MKTGIELIAEERHQQIEKHGFTKERDSAHTNDELKMAAVYLLGGGNDSYPENWDKKYQQQLDKKPKLEKLAIAGALIAAEIDRLNNQ